jgi:hypothetical protein
MDIRDLIQRQKLFYEASPYHEVNVEGPQEHFTHRKRVLAGFDVDFYATGAAGPLRLSIGDQQLIVVKKQGYTGYKISVLTGAVGRSRQHAGH